MDLFLAYVKWKCTECTQKSYISSFWPISWSSGPLKRPLHYQQSTFNGSYFLKSLHKLVLPETVFISYFWGMEMYKMCLKVVYLAILVNFRDP